jgi:pimeloyl-ACP methyl ester carboxylesterase
VAHVAVDRSTVSRVTTVDDTLNDDGYDEFALLHENAEEWDLPFDEPPTVARSSMPLGDGQVVSYLRWRTDEPGVVFLHGGAQNAHTWDTVILALGRPALAIDLPGHGHSDRRADMDYGPWRNAEVVATVLEHIAPNAACVVGMSLGGATTIRLAATRPDVCRKAVLVDVTPQINDPTREMTTIERGSVALIAGPPVWDTFEEMAEMAVSLSPFRAASGVRRGARHNSRRTDDGKWTWRYDLFGPWPEGAGSWIDFTPLWDDVSRIAVPVLFVRGGESRYVRDEDIEEMQRRLPRMELATVAGAGHAVQSDQPLELVKLLRRFI